MEYRNLGNTDLKVSKLGFGASPLGNVFGNIDRSEGKLAVDFAIDNGINFFDVSPYYGLTLAEERLGSMLSGQRENVVLATKCGRYDDAVFDFSAKRITASIDESLRRLRTDYVDLFQVHDVEFGELHQIIYETLPAMRLLQERGKTRYVGITGYSLSMLAHIAETAPVDTVLSYCRYNLMTMDMDDVLTPVAKKHGIGLINASAMSMGLLTEGGAPAWHPAPQEVREAARKAVEYCHGRGVDISVLALQFCLDHPCVANTLVGMSTVHQVQQNLNASEMILDRGLLAEVRQILKPVFNYVWPSGRPENNG
jgi:L-galactose dehydrogenase